MALRTLHTVAPLLCLLPGVWCAACGEDAVPEADADARDAAVAVDAGPREVDAAEALVEDASAAVDAALPESPVIDHMGWRTYDAALDPLASHQPTPVECGIAGWYADTRSKLLDVETSACNYVLLAHPALVQVSEGDELHLRLYYFDLIAPEPAEAHLAILLDDTVAWETHVAIPKPADAIDVRFRAPRALEEGEPLRLHLHNHGQNSWILAQINRVDPP